MIIRQMLAAIAGLAIAGHAAAQSAAPANATVELVFSGIAQPKGEILAVLVDEAGWSDRAQPVRAVAVPVHGAVARVALEGVAPGRYAVKAFHDLDGDRKLGVSPFGVPVEPYAFSNDATGTMGPPSFEAAAFDVGAGRTVQSIHIQ